MASEKAGKGPFVLIYNPVHNLVVEMPGKTWPVAQPRLWPWDKPLPEGWEACPIVQQYTLRPEPEGPLSERCTAYHGSSRCERPIGHLGKHMTYTDSGEVVSLLWAEMPEPEPKPEPDRCSVWRGGACCSHDLHHGGRHYFTLSWHAV